MKIFQWLTGWWIWRMWRRRPEPLTDEDARRIRAESQEHAQKVNEALWLGVRNQVGWLAPGSVVKTEGTGISPHMAGQAERVTATELSMRSWISVKDRLPELMAEVLVWTGREREIAYREEIHSNGRWVWWLYDNPQEMCSVTHWMPLSEPPEEQ